MGNFCSWTVLLPKVARVERDESATLGLTSSVKAVLPGGGADSLVTAALHQQRLLPAGENVDMMAEYMPLDSFQRIYIVDLCKSLCEVARKKVRDKGWKNVVVIEGDACTFVPPEGKAQLITFSYSLSSAPLRLQQPRSQSRTWPPPSCTPNAAANSPFCSSRTLLLARSDPAVPHGGGSRNHVPGPGARPAGRHRLLCALALRPAAASDVMVPALPLAVRRLLLPTAVHAVVAALAASSQVHPGRRATFDTDNIDIGPERRDYLDHRLSRVWEMNSQVCASKFLCFHC